MEIRKISAESIGWEEMLRLLELEKGIGKTYPDPSKLRLLLDRLDCFAFYDGDVLAGFVMADPKCPYFPGSVSIKRLKYGWEYNSEAFIAAILCRTAAEYPSRLICMDVDRRRDVNRELYRKIGFSDSVMPSPISRDHAVMIAEEKSLCLLNR